MSGPSSSSDGNPDGKPDSPRGRLGLILGSAAAELALNPPPGVEVVRRHHPTDSADPEAFVPAHLVDHAANVARLRDAGCDRVLSVNSVGSLRPDWPVGTVVAPEDFFAPAVNPSFFGDDRGHSVPGFDQRFRADVVTTWNRIAAHPLAGGGTYAQTTGPRFETPAEVRFLATVADVVGMTVAAECILAKEAGLAYAAICVIDNLANGLAPSGEPLTVDEFNAGKEATRAETGATLTAVVASLTPTDTSRPAEGDPRP